MLHTLATFSLRSVCLTACPLVCSHPAAPRLFSFTLQLARNQQLDQFFVRNLNKDPDGWELQDQTFDAVVCCVRCVGADAKPEELEGGGAGPAPLSAPGCRPSTYRTCLPSLPC